MLPPALTTDPLLPRRDLTRAPSELWRPPPHVHARSPYARALAALRRFFDLQALTIWRDLARVLPLLKGTLVDVGCGAQPYRLLLPETTRYRGIDRSDASNRFGYVIPDTTYYDGNRWPVEDEAADAVLCTEVLEHVQEPSDFLAEARRCLRPGGRLVLTVPFAARWHYIPHDYWRFTPSSLALLLDRAGFGDVHVFQRGNPLTVASYKTMALLLPVVMPGTKRLAARLALLIPGALSILPLFMLAALGNLSLAFDYGDDCLGYTVFATKGTSQA